MRHPATTRRPPVLDRPKVNSPARFRRYDRPRGDDRLVRRRWYRVETNRESPHSVSSYARSVALRMRSRFISCRSPETAFSFVESQFLRARWGGGVRLRRTFVARFAAIRLWLRPRLNRLRIKHPPRQRTSLRSSLRSNDSRLRRSLPFLRPAFARIVRVRRLVPFCLVVNRSAVFRSSPTLVR